MIVRLLVLAVLIAGIAGTTLWYRRRSAADAGLGASDAAGDAWPALPSDLRGDRPTWIVLSTPLCASCGQVTDALAEAFPHHRVRRVDATERTELADDYALRRAPTTLLADPDGAILARLVGPEAVIDFVGTADGALGALAESA